MPNTLLAAARGRLRQPPVNTSRMHLRSFAAEAAGQGRDKRFRVLDAGAGKQPYRQLFDHVSYEAADLVDSPGLEYVCDLTALPMADDSYDLVFCSQTLEHLTDPLQALREMRRVLRPGGQAWLTAPLFYEEHVKPYDYYRYTRFAWRHLAGQAGFRVDRIDWLEGYFGTLSYQLHMAYQALPRDMRVWRYLLLHLSRRLADREIRERYTPKNRGMCKNYRVQLTNPG